MNLTAEHLRPKEEEMARDTIVPSIEVIRAAGVRVGTVEKIDGGRARLAKRGSSGDPHHNRVHLIDLGLVADVEGREIPLSANAAVTFEEERSGKPVF
jgi:hypothetical protein